MQLEDRFYTSTEVAEILGVSLRSVYRYLEDNKLNAEVKTATGRHRFTRQNILDFLYPDGMKSKIFEEDKEEPKVEARPKLLREEQKEVKVVVEETHTKSTENVEEEDEEPVDWLSKFREAASKYKEEPVQQIPQQPEPQVSVQPEAAPQYQQYQAAPQQSQVQAQPQPIPQQVPVQQPQETGPSVMYYRSMLGGLKDIAQNLDKSARNSNLDYAFTLNAGASLHKPIKPFATLHSYVKSTDRDFFEKILRLTPANKTSAQLALVISDDSSIYTNKEEVHGLFVVAKNQLKKDISSFGDVQLAQEMADLL